MPLQASLFLFVQSQASTKSVGRFSLSSYYVSSSEKCHVPRSASSAGRSIPESPVRRPRVRDIPKMYYELPQSPPIEAKVYRPPFWSEDTWGTADCVSPKELNKRGLTKTLSGKNLTLR